MWSSGQREAEYSFGRLVLDGRQYTRDVIVLPGRVVENWWRREGHSLCIEDLGEVLGEDVDVLVVGTGAHGVMKVPSEVVEELGRRGIKVIAEPTDRAVRTFCKLRAEGRRVAGAFHLTC